MYKFIVNNKIIYKMSGRNRTEWKIKASHIENPAENDVNIMNSLSTTGGITAGGLINFDNTLSVHNNIDTQLGNSFTLNPHGVALHQNDSAIGSTTPNRINFNGNNQGIGCSQYRLCFYSNHSFLFIGKQNGGILAYIDDYGQLYVKNNIFSYNLNGNQSVAIGSDDRIKHNEVNIENGLSVIRQLQPQKYQKTKEMYPADYIGEISGDWIWECGVIAQEILKIDDISFSVTGGDEIGPSGETIEKKYYLNYNNLFTYGLAAIKELDQIVATQATTIANLEQENATMKAALNELLTAAGKSTI